MSNLTGGTMIALWVVYAVVWFYTGNLLLLHLILDEL